MDPQSVDQKDPVAFIRKEIDNLVERKPSLTEALDAFGKLMIAGAEMRAELSSRPGPRIAAPDPARLGAGVPLLHDMAFDEIIPDISAGIGNMLTTVAQSFPAIASDVEKMRARVDTDFNAPATWMALLIQNDEAVLKKAAADLDLEAGVLRFALEQSLKPFFQWFAQASAGHVESIRWDRGYCPICGAFPDTSFLRKQVDPQENLVAHGGQRWLHCSLCSHEWRLHRVVCPQCGNEDSETLEYLAAEDTAHERLYVCRKCNMYMTCLDTSELIEVPCSDLIAFELLHLDIIAQEKGLTPLAWRRWNSMPE